MSVIAIILRGLLIVGVPALVIWSLPTSTAGYNPAGSIGTSASRSVSPPPPDTDDPVRYDDCDDVLDTLGRAILATEDGYRRGLDRDNDGIGCERGDRATSRDDDDDDGRDDDGGDTGRDDNGDGNDDDTTDDRDVTVYVNGSDDDGDTALDSGSSVVGTTDDTTATFEQWETVPLGPIDTGGA